VVEGRRSRRGVVCWYVQSRGGQAAEGQAAGARELLVALRGCCEVGGRPNEQGVIVDCVDDDLLVLELVGKRLEDLARVDNVEDD